MVALLCTLPSACATRGAGEHERWTTACTVFGDCDVASGLPAECLVWRTAHEAQVVLQIGSTDLHGGGSDRVCAWYMARGAADFHCGRDDSFGGGGGAGGSRRMETRTAAEYGMQGAGTSCDASDRKPSACDDAARACTRAAERWGAQEAGAFATTVESEGGLAACELSTSVVFGAQPNWSGLRDGINSNGALSSFAGGDARRISGCCACVNARRGSEGDGPRRSLRVATGSMQVRQGVAGVAQLNAVGGLAVVDAGEAIRLLRIYKGPRFGVARRVITGALPTIVVSRAGQMVTLELLRRTVVAYRCNAAHFEALMEAQLGRIQGTRRAGRYDSSVHFRYDGFEDASTLGASSSPTCWWSGGQLRGQSGCGCRLAGTYGRMKVCGSGRRFRAWRCVGDS